MGHSKAYSKNTLSSLMPYSIKSYVVSQTPKIRRILFYISISNWSQMFFFTCQHLVSSLFIVLPKHLGNVRVSIHICPRYIDYRENHKRDERTHICPEKSNKLQCNCSTEKCLTVRQVEATCYFLLIISMFYHSSDTCYKIQEVVFGIWSNWSSLDVRKGSRRPRETFCTSNRLHFETFYWLADSSLMLNFIIVSYIKDKDIFSSMH